MGSLRTRFWWVSEMSRAIRALSAPFRLFNSIRDDVAKDRRLRLNDGSGWSFFGRTASSGKSVTIDSALQLSTVWACVKVSAQAVSSLPLGIYERAGDNDRRSVSYEDDRSGLVETLTESPNSDQTPLEFWESMVGWLLTGGNGYSEISEVGKRLSALTPLPGSMCAPFRTNEGELRYRFNDRGKVEVLPRDKILHIKGFGQGLRNLDMGLSPIAVGTNSIGAAMAAHEAAASTFANGMRPSGFMLFDQELTDTQRANAKKNLIDPLSGSSNAGSIGLLEQGTKWVATQLNPEDAQMLETRAFDVEEICRWFGVPPVVVGHAGKGQTMWGSGVEQILISWLTLGIDPICDRIEGRIRKQLIRPYSRKRYAEFNREALLQMDSGAKARFLSTMVQNGLMTRAEGRSKLNLAKKDGTDVLTAQTNLAPLDQLGRDTSAGSMRAAMRAFLGIDDHDPTLDEMAAKDKANEHA